MTTGEKIKKLRTDRGLTQEELGKLVGVQKSAINKWEKGLVTNIKRDTLKALAGVFGVSPADLLDDEDNRSDTDDLKQKLFERTELRMLFDAADNATAEDIEMVAKMLEKMTNKQV